MSDLLFNPPRIKREKRRYRFQVSDGLFVRDPENILLRGQDVYFLAKKQDTNTSLSGTPGPLASKRNPLFNLYLTLDLEREASWFLQAELPSTEAFALNDKKLIWQNQEGLVVLRERGQGASFSSKQHIFPAPNGQALAFHIGSEIWLLSRDQREDQDRLYVLRDDTWVNLPPYSSREGLRSYLHGDKQILFYPEAISTLSHEGPGKMYVSPLLSETIVQNPENIAPGAGAGQYFFLQEGDLFFADLEENKLEALHSSGPGFIVSQDNLLALVTEDEITVFEGREQLFSFRSHKNNFTRATFVPDGLVLWSRGERFYKKILFSL